MFKILFLPLFFTFLGNPNQDSLDTYLNHLNKEGKLNGNVLVIQNGKTVFEKSFGYTNGSKETKLNKNYRFIIGSVYKEFPAVSIMQLKEKNLLHLEDNVAQYLPELPKWAEKVTIKQLLQYSSGLPLVNWREFFSKEISITEEALMKEIQKIDSLQFEPGTNYLYSNNNPILLIKIIEKVSKMNYEQYLQKNILLPFHMKTTLLKDKYPFLNKKRMAIPFDSTFIEDTYEIAFKGLLLATTAKDIAVWFEQLDDFKIISKQDVKTLSEVAIEGENIQAPLGSAIWQNENLLEHAHHGQSGNYECLIRRFKEEKLTIVILTNQKNKNVHEISDTIYTILKKEK